MFVPRVSLHINLQKIQENYLEIEKECSPCMLMPILKANAYGLGALEISKALQEVGAKYIGVADLSEAHQIANVIEKVLLLGMMLPEELSSLKQNIYPSIATYESAFLLNQLAIEQNRVIRVHILVDSGMGRLGIPIEEALPEII